MSLLPQSPHFFAKIVLKSFGGVSNLKSFPSAEAAHTLLLPIVVIFQKLFDSVVNTLNRRDD
jgi:hypothetical protein